MRPGVGVVDGVTRLPIHYTEPYGMSARGAISILVIIVAFAARNATRNIGDV